MRFCFLRGVLVGFVFLILPTSLAAQVPEPRPATGDTVPRLELPWEIAEPIFGFLNQPTTIQFTGRVSIPVGATISGDVGVVGGPVHVAGRIEGDLVVVDGDLEFASGAAVTGNVTVVGGAITGLDAAEIGGRVAAFSQRLLFRRLAGRIEPIDREPVGPSEVTLAGAAKGRRDLIIATAGGYNRVEGLPISVGPVFETGGLHPFRLRAEAIYRTESGASLDPEQMGYRVRAEQALTAGGALNIGATYASVIDPIEDWHLATLENSLATFFLHKDFRDHYERRGAGAYLRFQPDGIPWTFRLTAASERHRSVAAGSPWTVFRNQEAWRGQPLVAEGWLTSLRLDGRLDTRNASYDPSNGWLLSGSIERTVRSSLRDPERIAADATLRDDPPPSDPSSYSGFTHGVVDLRRYSRLSPETRLGVRLLLAGTLDSSPLPPQRQHALGGEGSLPGYGLFRLDCGARELAVYRGSEAPVPGFAQDQPPAFVPAYGCDRVALAQVELRGTLGLRFGVSDGSWGEAGHALDLGWGASPDWVVFASAGQGWSRQRPDEELALDFGVGVLFHRVGIFAALPLRGEGGMNVFVRLGPRF